MRTFFFLVLALLLASSAQAQVPHTFAAGETVSAQKMNENFQAVYDAGASVAHSLSRTIRSEGSTHNPDNYIGSGIVTASCDTGELLVGGSCSCMHLDSSSTTTNSGVLWACDLIGNSVLGLCAANNTTMSVNKYGPPITVYAVCMATGASTAKSMQAGTPQELSKEVQEMLYRLEKEMHEFSQAVP